MAKSDGYVVDFSKSPELKAGRMKIPGPKGLPGFKGKPGFVFDPELSPELKATRADLIAGDNAADLSYQGEQEEAEQEETAESEAEEGED